MRQKSNLEGAFSWLQTLSSLFEVFRPETYKYDIAK